MTIHNQKNSRKTLRAVATALACGLALVASQAQAQIRDHKVKLAFVTAADTGVLNGVDKFVELVKQTFGKEWNDAQIARAPGDRHQLMTWLDGLSEVIRRGRLDSRNQEADGVWSSVPTGDAWALLTFASQ